MSIPIIARNVVETAKICVPTVIEGALGKTGLTEPHDRRLRGWADRLSKIADIQLSVEGREQVPPGEAFVVMSNHQSHYDIVVLFQALPLSVRMVAKKELYRIPLFAGAMRVAGFVEIDRANRHQAMSALRGARAAIESGISIWIAPEGTRSETGRLGEFKKGGFHLALEAGARILPVTVAGTRHILQPHDWKIHKGKRVQVTIAAPIDPQQYGKARRPQLMADVRAAIERNLPSV